MTKSELSTAIHEQIGLSQKESSQIVENVFEIIKSVLERGEQVKISGFGNFVVKQKSPRRGRNPQTGETIMLPGRKVLNFKTSPVLKSALQKS